jgi:tetratricopeptide (TPR) repeat protein
LPVGGDLAAARWAMEESRRNFEKAKGHIETATAEYRQASAILPFQNEIRFSLARALAFDRQFPEAEAIYTSTIAKDEHLVQAYLELARVFEAQKQYGQVEETYRKGFAANPNDYDLLMGLARFYYQTSRPKQAIDVLQKVRSHAHEIKDYFQLTGMFYQSMGDGDEALRQYKEGARDDPKNKEIYQKLSIECLMRQGRKLEAWQANEAFLGEYPRDREARGRKGLLQLENGNPSESIRTLESVVAERPDNFVAQYNLGRACAAVGKTDEALRHYQEAIRVRADYTAAHYELAQLYAVSGHYEQAIGEADEILVAEPGNSKAQLLRCEALLGLRAYDRVKVPLENLVKLYPEWANAWVAMGMLNLAQHHYEQAAAAFRRGYDIQPSDTRGLLGLVETELAQRHEEQALQLLRAETRKSPARMDLWMALGSTERRLGRYEDAIASFKIARKLTGKPGALADIYLHLGEAYYVKRDRDSAIDMFSKARELVPDNADIAIKYGFSFEEAGRFAEARKAYEDAVRIDPGNWTALRNLANLIANSEGNLDEALSYAQRARKQAPRVSEVADTLGWIYVKKSETESAIELHREAVAADPKRPVYHYHLAVAYLQKGAKAEARKELEIALEQKPPIEEKAQIRQLLLGLK